MIDRELNYGRHQMQQLARKASLGFGLVKALDLGAGQGVDLLGFKSVYPRAELHGLEVYPPNVSKLVSLGVHTHRINLETTALPFDSEHIDFVMANQFLEHTKEIFWIFHEVSRVLKVGGFLLIGVPNLASLHNRLLLTLGKQPTCIQTASAHIRGFTRSDLLRFLNKCSPATYSQQGFLGSNFYPFPPQIAKPLAAIWPNAAVSFFLLLKKEQPYSDGFIQYPVTEKLETNYHLGTH